MQLVDSIAVVSGGIGGERARCSGGDGVGRRRVFHADVHALDIESVALFSLYFGTEF